MKKEWIFYNEPFQVDSAPELRQDLIINGPWSGHRRFAYDLVRFLKPSTIVELGTYYGTSFFSFCQAVKDEKLPTRAFAVDSWQGDPHNGYYGEEVYQAVQTVNAREFPNIGILMRSNFDDALSSFQDNSIDLLHIDGYHTYEAVRHDYTTWYPKLASNGIVLFHDITAFMRDYAVYRFWDELSDLPRFAFSHSYGLGVLFPKGVPDSFHSTFDQIDAFLAHY